MIESLAPWYLWLKAVHFISMIAWMAGLLYLPRLFVYHAGVAADSDAYGIFETMERRLLRVIVNPSGIVVFVTGILLIAATGYGAPGSGGWMHLKLLLVLALGALHGMMARYRKDFERRQNRKTEKFYRVFNEIPAVLMVAIVLLAVLKPF